ncbi:FkbM family methyltransferase [Romboutsia maritimum]|uniref:FkbM family methyltransferase n=1 Tax=Romboutsia maritimum TaxID=2020948 RepID=A0A371IVK4_9FIRM|nr:FkbM family methyltransferase [Romboutsia maritimum]RDY24510.1 FkbM family methyltransferase [Romboutsia maritimum]
MIKTEMLDADDKINVDDLKNKNVVLFGVGVYGQMVEQYLKEQDIEIAFYCDNNKDKQGTYINNIKVISPNEILKVDNYVVFVTARHCVKEILNQLKSMNIQAISFDNFIVNSRYEEFEYVYNDILGDEKSKEVYISILKSMLTGDSKYCEKIMEGSSFYALPNFTNTGNDIFVDAGAYVGDTVEQFIWNNIGQFKKIYAFEPGEKQFMAMQYRLSRLLKEWAIPENKIQCIKAGLGIKTEEKLYFENNDALLCNNFSGISAEGKAKKSMIYSLDEYLNGDRVTFIKSDIEGFEMELLKGSEKTLKSYKPKLAISVYHKPDDLIEITKYLKTIVPEYKMALRHHAPTLVDTVLYCWI